jgi:hypothetical protein
MPVSNTTLALLSSRPYFDDFDGDKQYYRILFRTGRRAIQVRELNQMQAILQDQLERQGSHLFKDGSVVLDGQLTFDTSVKSLKIDRTFGGNTVNLENFYDTTTGEGVIITGSTSAAKARVVQYDTQEGESEAILVISYLSSTPFVAGETITSDSHSASVSATDPIDDASVVSVDHGVYFIDGMFITCLKQTVVLEATSATPNYRIGFDATETIITEDIDRDLFDNALGSTNYLAPGAHRLKIDLVLTKKSLTAATPELAAADENFIELNRVVNGKLAIPASVPQYAELEKTLARRTYDESGNYTVKPFTIQIKDNIGGDATKLSIGVSAGKAYVQGYEYETLATNYVDLPKGRDTVHENNFDISMSFGNYFVANTITGFLNIENEDIIEIHSVAKASINATSNTTYRATQIGTARSRSLVYYTGGTGAARTYKIYVTDVRLLSQSFAAVSSNATAITLNTAATSYVNGAYDGATLTITAGPGVGQTFTISSYVANGTTSHWVNLTPNTYLGTFSANSSTTCRLDYTFAQAESFSKPTSKTDYTTLGGGNIATEGRIGNSPTGNAILYDRDNTLIFPLAHDWIKAGSLTDLNYEAYRVFSGVTFTGNSTVTTLTLSTNNGNERFYPSPKTLSTDEQLASYLVIRSSDGSIVPYDSTGVSDITIPTPTTGAPGQVTLTANASYLPTSNQVSVLARLNVDSAVPRLKTLVTGNGTSTAGSTNLTVGQVVIAAPNNTPGVVMSLYTPDVTALVKVYTTPNTATAPSNTYMTSQYDVTSQFVLDTGQRDNLYDHASITLAPGAAPVTGQLLVCFSYFSHSSTKGFLTVDSYGSITYENIPTYTSPTTGKSYALRDVIDFRPIRQANTSQTYTEVWSTILDAQLPHPVSTFEADYDHYLGRADALVVTRNREFKLVPGVSSPNPVPPPDDGDSMTIYRLTVAPYTANTSQVGIEYVENKRYTMRDIGRLERRIAHLEYYTALNFLEKAAQDQTVLDVNDNERFKNGILVDAFAGSNIADTKAADYLASIDIVNRLLKQTFVSNGFTTSFTSGSSSHVTKTGDLVTLAYTNDAFIIQPLASNTVPINPFQITNFLGTIDLSPSTDVWFDGATKPHILMNVVGENDNWKDIGFGTEWDGWRNRWIGLTDKPSERQSLPTVATDRTVDSSAASSNVISRLIPEHITKEYGNRVIDASVVPLMRTQSVMFGGHGLRPGATVEAYFDQTDVTGYVERANILTLSSNAAFLDTTGIFELVTSNGTTVGTGRVVSVQGNRVKIVNANGQFLFANGAGTLITGNVSTLTANVTAYDHWSGPVGSANSTGIVLDSGASANNDYYNGLTIYVTSGPGAGSSATIVDYTGASKFAQINVSTSTINTSALTANSRYSIGSLVADGLANSSVFQTAGDIHGIFWVPDNSSLMFETGSRLFRLTDNTDQTAATTAAEAQYFAQGTTTTFSPMAISTRPLQLQRSAVSNDSVVITNRVVQEDHSEWIDPIVQTVIVDPNRYPSGVFVSKLDLFFASKDTNGLPVSVQIRPTLNGYALNGVVLPFSSVTLNPDDVNVSASPSVSDANTVTSFTFPGLVHLLPGEYAVVIHSNSQEYSLYTAEIGSQQINSTLTITRQPYSGKFFKTQNAGIWAPADDEDLMFQLHRAVFPTTTTGAAVFTVQNPSANVDFDEFYVASGHLDFAGTVTSMNYQVANTAGTLQSTATLTPNQDVELSTRARLLNSGNTMVLGVTMTTTDDAVSPVFDTERLALVTVQNQIGTGELFANGFVVTNPGTGYAASANITLTISGTGSGANAVATTNSAGNITGVTVVSAGSGYIETPTITVGGGGSGAAISYIGETSQIGGNGLTRYITRRVTLADGFDASDLIVYLSASRPSDTDIDVYYKVLAAGDNESFDQKSWTRFATSTIATNPLIFSSDSSDFKEFVFTTANNKITYVANGNTYSRFKTFAIKIVLRSTITTITPAVRDLRVIALDD